MSGPRAIVTLKLATSLDGRIALADGRSKWITGHEAREEVHTMRARHDVILTGVATVLADNPRLTARPGGAPADRQPWRVVLDTRLRTPAGAAIFEAGAVQVYHVDGESAAARDLKAAGASLHQVAADAAGRCDLHAALRHLAGQGAQSVMIEAGGVLAGAAIRAGLVDRIEWFRAPMLIGEDGRACIAALDLESLDLAPIFTRTQVRPVGRDLWETYERG